jgi:hypothetical protein
MFCFCLVQLWVFFRLLMLLCGRGSDHWTHVSVLPSKEMAVKSVSGLFDRYSKAEWALEVLGIYGVSNQQVSVVARGSRDVTVDNAIAQFVEMGFTREEGEFYAEGVQQGGFLITVAIESEDEFFLRGLLRRAGAEDMNTRRKIMRHGNTFILNSTMSANI